MTGAERNPQKMKVAVVIPTHWDFRMGGSQYQAKLLIEELYRAHGASVTYFAARTSSQRHFTDHEVVRVGHGKAPRHYGHFWDYFQLQKALRNFAPDVIYQRVGCAYTGISALYAKRSGTPMIWHIASAGDCQKPPPVRQLLGRPHVFIESRLAKRGVVDADVIVAQSQEQVTALQENFGRTPDRLIRNFQEVPEAIDKRLDRLTVLWIGNLKRIKRPELFIEIASQFRQHSEIDFVMIGRGYRSPSVQGRFEQVLKRNTNLKYLGALPQEEVNRWLERSHLLVNTSQSEGFSNTFIQAWMRAVPVLTLGVNPDGLLDGGCLGSSCDSTSEVAESIRRLTSDLGMLRDMGEESRQYAVDQFSMKNAAELADLIVQTAGEKHEKSAEF